MWGELNPRERWGLLLIDERPDRPPVWPLVTTHAAEFAGCGLKAYCTEGRTQAEAQLAARRHYGHEGLSVFTDVGIIAEAFGSTYCISDEDTPYLLEPAVARPDDAGRLILPQPERSARLPLYLEAVERLFAAEGDVVPVFAFIPGPFTTAGELRGVESFLADTLVAPEAAHLLLEAALAAAIDLSNACMIRGALPVIVDPLASGSVISRRTFERFALPYLQRLIAQQHRYDLDVTLHICGRTETHLDLIKRTGADLFSFDEAGAGKVSSAMGDDVRLVGNLSPSKLLPESGEDISGEIESLLATGIAHRKGFVLSTGCEVPVRCNQAKLSRIIDIGRRSTYREPFQPMFPVTG